MLAREFGLEERNWILPPKHGSVYEPEQVEHIIRRFAPVQEGVDRRRYVERIVATEMNQSFVHDDFASGVLLESLEIGKMAFDSFLAW